jgi:hypothetical protein
MIFTDGWIDGVRAERYSVYALMISEIANEKMKISSVSVTFDKSVVELLSC